MRLELLSVALRQRDPWEATDLGIALWRRHFAAILRPWLLVSLPILALLGTLGWAIDSVWLSVLLMWWLKPFFDRIPLYVLSRAVFGSVPTTRQVLRAPELLRPGLAAWLTWRRLHPARALLLPVDLLEGVGGARRGLRASVLLRAVGAQALGMIFAFLVFELSLLFAMQWIGLMFVPTEFLSDSARAMFDAIYKQPPMWAQLLSLCLWWLAASVMEPIYVAAGFGLYLNRRTQLEAWDLELAFRRLAARARALNEAALALAPLAVLCGAMACFSAPAAASDKQPPRVSPEQMAGESARAPSPRFEKAMEHALQDPSLSGTKTVKHWVLRTPKDLPKDKPEEKPADWILALGSLVSAIGEYGLWTLVAVLLLLVLWRLPKWLPWVRRQLRAEPELPEVHEEAVVEDAPLPDDVPGAVDALWREGRRRDALSMLYRAGVERLSGRLQVAFPPGATEADCLRRARRLEDEGARASFTAVVRTWQRAAYARQFPDDASFAALVAGWAQRFPAAA